MNLQSSPLTVILPLLPKNCYSLLNPGYVIGELKLMRLRPSMWHSLQDETHAHRSVKMTREYLKRTMSNTLDFISIAALPGTHTFFLNVNSWDSRSPRSTGYSGASPNSLSKQTPHLQSNTQTHLDIRHSTLEYNIQFKHWNFRTFSIQSLATNSGRNRPIQLPLQYSHQSTPQWTHRLTHRAANPKAPASILAPRPACPILGTCINCISCL
jgi:hypothetical protein